MGMFTVSTIIYILFASGDEQWWNNPNHPNFGRNVENGIKSEKEKKEAEVSAISEKIEMGKC